MNSPLSQRGSALIITLTMLCLITVLLVGFALSMRFDLTSSASHLGRVEADLYARMGGDAAQAELANAIGSTNVFWVSQPGRIILFQGGNTTALDLSSGSAPLTATTDQAANLNPSSFSSATGNLIAPTNQPMQVAWIYVNQDGTFTTNAPPSYAPSNPVVGRFAFWVDDESTKINLNTAWTRATENTNTLSHPSRIELSNLFNLLTQSDADSIQATRTNFPYNSLWDACRGGGNLTNAIAQQSFSLTGYNHAPDQNMFNRPRIMLTTSTTWAGGTNCFNILASPGADPGSAANLSAAGVNTAVNTLYGYLTNSTWPLMPGASFANKYAAGNNSRAMQLAVDLIEYVRCAESTNPVVQPIRGDCSASGFTYGNVYDANALIGNTRRPFITEMGLYMPAVTTSPTNLPVTLKVKVYLPPNCGITSPLSLTNFSLTLLAWIVPTTNTSSSAQITSTEANPSSITNGQYSVITQTFNWTNLTARPSKITLRAALTTLPVGTGTLIDVAPLQTGSGTNATPFYTLDPVNVSLANITSLSVDDPAVNKRNTDWVQGPNAFGAANSGVSTLGGSPGNYSPQQDTDSSGKLTSVGMAFPAPKGSTANPYGMVQSVGELGYVHTGIECIVTNQGIGAPWRTLRLQPEKSGRTDLPDWALLDLFSVPVLNTNAFIRPNLQSWGGEINLNGRIPSFVDTSSNSIFTRLAPLQALLLNATNANSPAVTTLASAQYPQAASKVLQC